MENQSAIRIVQDNLDAYNNRDIETFMSSFSESIKMFNLGNPSPTLEGLAAVRKYYGELFEVSPQLQSEIIQRICIGHKVIDHESITGRKGSKEIVEMVLIYEVEMDKICRITVVK